MKQGCDLSRSLARHGCGKTVTTTMPYLDCTTAGQIIWHHVLFTCFYICVWILRIDWKEKIEHFWPPRSPYLTPVDIQCVLPQDRLYGIMFSLPASTSAFGFFGSTDKNKWNTFGLRDLLSSLQSTSNVDGLYYRRTDCTVSCSLYLHLHLRLDSSDRLVRINGTLLASAISWAHSSRHLMWMYCTTAGQIVRYHVLFTCFYICVWILRIDW